MKVIIQHLRMNARDPDAVRCDPVGYQFDVSVEGKVVTQLPGNEYIVEYYYNGTQFHGKFNVNNLEFV